MFSLCDKKWRLLFVAASLFFLQACATSSSIEEARGQYFAGQPDLALQTLKTGETSDRDKLLKHMEAGMIAHSAGLYKESSQELIQAAALVEEYNTIRISEQSAALVTNDWLLSYKGEYSERLWIHTIQMMNFLLMGEPEGAAVEARQALQQYEQHGDSLNNDWFTRALIAASFEEAGKYDSAHIEYKKLLNTIGHDSSWAQAAINNAVRLGRSNDSDEFKNKLAQSSKRVVLNSSKQSGDVGELVLFVQSGVIQNKVAGDIWFDHDMRVSFPTYPNFYVKPLIVEVKTNSTALGSESIDTVMVDIARKSLEARAGSLTTRQIMRLSAKHAISELAAEEDELLGAFVSAVMFISEEADTRSWQTLPKQLALVRIPLTVGTHENITVNINDGIQDHSVLIPSVNIAKDRRSYRKVHVGRGTTAMDSATPPAL